MVAALIAVGALIVRWLRTSGVERLGPFGVPTNVVRPPVDREALSERSEIVTDATVEVEALWDDLKGDDPEGDIADAANRARGSQ